MRDEKVAAKSRNISGYYFTVAVKSSRDISAEPVRDRKSKNML